ncbi:spindle and kinetochore-associated protein 1 isoform X2 [Epinephelus moara]|uniref:spindle and kinetochore-associated protein 1 isoform X2 n=1 Tax=Epinephelus moara TaxID=300413 RepID=UPI00214EA203|nr:spindle and kinetochore-associated protein 1 isoform X2 [Epinephelus moara]
MSELEDISHHIHDRISSLQRLLDLSVVEFPQNKIKKLGQELFALERLLEEFEKCVDQQKEQLRHLKSSHDSMSGSPAPSTSTGRGRARGRGPGVRGGRGGRGRGRGSGHGLLSKLQLEPEDLQRIQALQTEQIAYEDALIGSMDLSASHQMIRAVLQNDPSYIFDLRSDTSGALPVPGSTAGPSWCVCGRCREMPTDLERKRCGHQPDECLSIMP